VSLGGTVDLLLADLAVTPAVVPDGTTLSLVTYGGSWNDGVFSDAGSPLADGGFINIVAVPEPSTAVLLLAAVAWAGLRRRRTSWDAGHASVPMAGECATKSKNGRSPSCPMV
jgi:hypothetical protein